MKYEELFDKMARGPAFLFLGQDYLRLETGKDPFLAEVVRKYGNSDQTANVYTTLFDLIPPTTTETALAWMQNRCMHLPGPRWLEEVAAFAWSGIYTSAIDIIWPQFFQSKWRTLEPILEERQHPLDPRNRSKLHSTFLFGRVDQVEEEKRPPLLYEEWLTRKPIAMSLARRLPEWITPFGTLVLEGYAGERDWFHPDDLFPILSACNVGQVYIFSANEQLLKHRTLSALYRSGKLIPFEESLASVLTRGIEINALIAGIPLEEERGKSLKIADRYITIPPTIWTRVSASATILDDGQLAGLPALSAEKRYDAFRQFLSRASMKPQWSGYEAGFAFARPFEKTLYEEVSKRLRSREQQPPPVLVHGQTGTGKTVALGALAYRILKEHKYPVLFIERQSQRPMDFFSDIDVFCEWAENHGASSTLVVWDGMVEPEYYNTLLQYLAGRGHKAVLVGSCYLITTDAARLRRHSNLVEAKADIIPEEQQELVTFLEGIDSSLEPISSLVRLYGNTSFLVALYRLLPPTRSQLRQGLDEEVQFTEEEIRRKVSDLRVEPEVGALAFALLKVGVISEQQLLLSAEKKIIDGEQVDELRELIGLIMVPGRFGLKVPIELLLRALGKQTILHFVSLLKGIDLFRWDEDVIGNIAIGPRHPLEAKLVAQAYLGRAETEVEYARRLLIEIRDQDTFLDSSEIQFAVDLVRSMGPNSGLDAGYFAPHFLALSNALRDLREERGVQHPRLMLQEATLLREAVRQNDNRLSLTTVVDLLDKSEYVLHQALKRLQEDRKNSRLRGVLLVELAATLGTKMQHFLKDASRRQDSLQLFKETSGHLFEVMSLDSKDYHPIDVLAWTTKNLLNSHLLDDIPSTRAEVEGDILHAFEIAQAEDLDPVLLNTRKWEIGKAIGNAALSDEAFAALLAQGSCAGLYLRAKQIAGELPQGHVLTATQRRQCEQAVQYLEEQRQLIAHDGRCLHLLLNLWWMSQTGKPIFSSFVRQTVAFTFQQWQYCFTLVRDLMALEDLYNTPRLRYLHGLATFHLGRVREAFQIFRDLERISENQGSIRVRRSYLASDEQGNPQTFEGTVEQVERTKGVLYIGALRQKVPFFVRDFNRPNILRGESLHGFHLAFNFIGPIADPESLFENQQRREG